MSLRTIREYGFPCLFPVTDLSGGASTYGPKFSQFHAVFRKIWQNHMLTSPGGLAPPPTGNSGFVPAFESKLKSEVKLLNQFLVLFGPESYVQSRVI